MHYFWHYEMKRQQMLPKRSGVALLIKLSLFAAFTLSLFVLLYFYRLRRSFGQREGFAGTKNCGPRCLSLNNWSSYNATILSMVGFMPIAQVDIRDSRNYLADQIARLNVCTGLALDVGSGIGRISKDVLLPVFKKVDAVDGTKKFIEAYPNYVGSSLRHKIGQLYVSPLEEFQPKLATYDLIWIQWVTMHMGDDDVISFLRKSKEAIKQGGIIIVKENMVDDIKDHIHEIQHTIARSSSSFDRLFAEAGVKIFDKRRQTGFPRTPYTPIFFTLT